MMLTNKNGNTMNKSRLEAFSDGVLAIIITIMVLEIDIPESSDWSELKHLVPVFISYLFKMCIRDRL